MLKKGRFVKGELVKLKYINRIQNSEDRIQKPEAGIRDPSTNSRQVYELGIKDKEELTFNSRVAVVVSAKVFKRAVDRNRAKRLVRESVRHLVNQIKPGYDLVFLVQSEIVDKKQPEVERDVKVVLGKGGILYS